MSQHHRAQHWTTHTGKLRPAIAATLPAPCVECGRPVEPGTRWQVGHIVPASAGGRPVASNVGPVHTSCNLKAGGKLGAAAVNRRRRQSDGMRPW